MDIIRKICLLIIAISLGSVFYIAYNYIKFMRGFNVLNIGKMVKETIQFFVFIVIFGMIISFTLDIMLKKRAEPTTSLDY
jgi:uncharacterized membrane-anchored protein